MGLIKTAIMTGGGIYAVKKIAQAAEKRRESPAPNNQNYSRDGGYSNQGQWGPPGPPPRGPPQADNTYGDYQQQQQQSYSNNAPYARGFSAGDYEDERYPVTGADFENQSRNRQIAPPSYYPQQGNERSQNQNQNQCREKNESSPVDGLVDMALDFAGKSGGRKGRSV
jgi:hypothetical protein